jgi:hypothetical protein
MFAVNAYLAMSVYATNAVRHREEMMPKVGRRKFAYTKTGKKAAKAYAKKSGKKVKKAKGY